jgi:hypothetical protein
VAFGSAGRSRALTKSGLSQAVAEAQQRLKGSYAGNFDFDEMGADRFTDGQLSHAGAD